jgi:hypothetical protein
MATIAPQSMSASAVIAACVDTPDYFTNGLSISEVASAENANERLGGGVQLLLIFVCVIRFHC